MITLAYLRSSFIVLSRAPLAALLVIGALGCSRNPNSPSDPRLDPELVSIDHAAPFADLGSQHGSILLGDGWSSKDRGRDNGEDIVLAWASEMAEIWVERPVATSVDFVGRCRPYVFPGSRRQRVSIHVNGRKVGRKLLRRGWQDLRLRLDPGALAPGLNRVQLRFRYATRPIDVKEGSTEHRFLSVGCQSLGIVPRQLENYEAFRRASELNEAKRELRLPLGGAATFPLPPDVRADLRLRIVRARCNDCNLRIELLHNTRGDHLVSEQPVENTVVTASLTTPAKGVSHLRLSFNHPDGEIYDPSRTVRISLPEDFLRFTRHRPPITGAKPSIFIYLIDTLRSDIRHGTTYDADKTPAFASFAEEAVVYENAWTASSWTLPSVVSVLSGVYPFRHGVMKGNLKFSESNAPSLALMATEAGYETIGISQSFVASSRFGVDVGFEQFYLSNQLNSFFTSSQQVRRFLFTALRRDERPTFAYVHTVAPHAPYAPLGADRRFAENTPGSLEDRQYSPFTFMMEDRSEDPQEVAHLRSLYDGEIAYADRQFGRFVDMLRYLGLYDNSLIVLVSDHGEEFAEHGGFDHGRTVYDELLHIPLIVKYPGSRWAGQTVLQRVSTVDIAPTVLRVAGIDSTAARFDGRSLLPPDLSADATAPQRVVFAEVNPDRSADLESVDYRTIVRGDVKCIENLAGTDRFGEPEARWQTFDLAADPREQNALDPNDPRALRCRETMKQWLALDPAGQEPSLHEATSEEALGGLRALGYIE